MGGGGGLELSLARQGVARDGTCSAAQVAQVLMLRHEILKKDNPEGQSAKKQLQSNSWAPTLRILRHSDYLLPSPNLYRSIEAPRTRLRQLKESV